MPGLLYGAKESIAHSTLLRVMIFVATRQSARVVRQTTAGVTPPSITTEEGKCVSSKRSKVSPSDCVRSPVGATKDPSLIFGSLERALCNLADLGKSFMELQKVLQVSLEALHPSFLYLR